MAIVLDDYTFWIPGNTVSSKNNMIWTGEYLAPSNLTNKWRRGSASSWIGQAMWFHYMISMLPDPIYLELTFYRKARNKFDYINPAQSILDEMVGAARLSKIKKMAGYEGQSFFNKKYIGQLFWLIDDNIHYVKPYFGDWVHSKDEPGCLIRILKDKPVHYDIQAYHTGS